MRCRRFFFFFFELSRPSAPPPTPFIEAPLPALTPLPPLPPPLPSTESESRSISQLIKPECEKKVNRIRLIDIPNYKGDKI